MQIESKLNNLLHEDEEDEILEIGHLNNFSSHKDDSGKGNLASKEWIVANKESSLVYESNPITDH